MNTLFSVLPGCITLNECRVALYNYFYANRFNGNTILVFDDLLNNNNPSLYDDIISTINWLGLKVDMHRRSTRMKRYAEAAEKLITLGHAYPCNEKFVLAPFRGINRNMTSTVCSELYMDTGGLLRLKIEEGNYHFDDLSGEIELTDNDLDDTILVYSDGKPSNLFANAIDIIDFGITHQVCLTENVLRTIYSAIIIHYMGEIPPVFAHIGHLTNLSDENIDNCSGPELNNPAIVSRLKLLKFTEAEIANRDELNPKNVDFYGTIGVPPAAIINYLTGIGWNKNTEELFYSQDRLKTFDIADLSRSPIHIQPDLFKFLSQLHIGNMESKDIVEYSKVYFKQSEFEKHKEKLIKYVNKYKNSIKVFSDLVFFTEFIFEKPKPTKDLFKSLKDKMIHTIYSLSHTFQSCDDPEKLETLGEMYAKVMEVNVSEITDALKLCIFGKKYAMTDVYFAINLIGLNESKERIKNAVTLLGLKK